MKFLKDISVRTLICFILFSFSVYCFIPLLLYFSEYKPIAMKFFISIPFLLLFITFFIYTYMTIYLVKPINKIQDALKEITLGKINTPIDLFGMNCAGKLIPQIKDMQNSIINIVNVINQSAKDISIEVNNLQKGNDELSVRTEQEHRSIQNTADNIKNLYSFSHQNENEAKEVYNHTQHTLESISETLDNTKTLTLSINNISEQSSEINKISDFISEMAFKTNILSLNASIEAARAGSYGQGFSVVASEIRNLAQSCATSAKDIKKLVENSSGQIKKAVSLNDKNEEYIKEVSIMIERINDSLSKISQASLYQREKIENVNISVDEINIITQQNSNLSINTVRLSNNIKNKVSFLNQTISKFDI